ncbi:MAG: type II toxin-antitoxin system HicA family toxin [Pseudonocardiaceae bacterium]
MGGSMPIKMSEMITLIERDGWFLARTRGNHRQFKHITKPGKITIAGKPSSPTCLGMKAVWAGGRARSTRPARRRPDGTFIRAYRDRSAGDERCRHG